MLEAGSALLIVFLGLWAVQAGAQSAFVEREDEFVPARPCTAVSGLFEKDVFMLVFTEDLERLISFPRVRELNGRIRILKSGIVPTRPCYLLDFHRYVN